MAKLIKASPLSLDVSGVLVVVAADGLVLSSLRTFCLSWAALDSAAEGCIFSMGSETLAVVFGATGAGSGICGEVLLGGASIAVIVTGGWVVTGWVVVACGSGMALF